MKSIVPMLVIAAAASFGCKPQTPPEPPEPMEVRSEPEAEVEPEAEPEAPLDPDDVHIEGDHLVIDRHINFALNSDEILEDSFDLLDHIAQLLRNHPEIKKLHVIGHTDSAGGKKMNQELSERRANSVMEALKSRGITQEIDAMGKGMDDPLCQEDTDECHERNRRVEFIIEVEE